MEQSHKAQIWSVKCVCVHELNLLICLAKSRMKDDVHICYSKVSDKLKGIVVIVEEMVIRINADTICLCVEILPHLFIHAGTKYLS